MSLKSLFVSYTCLINWFQINYGYKRGYQRKGIFEECGVGTWCHEKNKLCAPINFYKWLKIN